MLRRFIIGAVVTLSLIGQVAFVTGVTADPPAEAEPAKAMDAPEVEADLETPSSVVGEADAPRVSDPKKAEATKASLPKKERPKATAPKKERPKVRPVREEKPEKTPPDKKVPKKKTPKKEPREPATPPVEFSRPAFAEPRPVESEPAAPTAIPGELDYQPQELIVDAPSSGKDPVQRADVVFQKPKFDFLESAPRQKYAAPLQKPIQRLGYQ